jgi:hypothetical protein
MREQIHDVVNRLFRDAGVSYERGSKRGKHYSIADEAYREFASWFNYPWDGELLGFTALPLTRQAGIQPLQNLLNKARVKYHAKNQILRLCPR